MRLRAARMGAPIHLRFAEVRQTSAFRLTAGLGGVFVIAVAVLLGVTYTLTESEQVARSDTVLYREIRHLAAVPPGRRADAVRAAMVGNASGLLYFALLDARGLRLVGNLHLRDAAHLPADRPFEQPAAPGQPVPMRVLVARLPDGQAIVVGRDNTTTIDLRWRMLIMLFASGMAVIASATVAGVALSLGPLRRIEALKRAARRIAAGELGRRMPVSARKDELDLIAGVVNTMIEEIERLMEQVKGTTDAIAHDLRTPLSRLRYRLQSLRERHGDALAGDDIDGGIQDLDGVLDRFTALLRISEIEASGRRAGFAMADLIELIAQICELYEPLAQEQGITLSMQGAYGHVIACDRGLMLEAISNLVENALKFVPPGGHVRVAILTGAHGVAIEVRDDGPGIPASERSMVLRRFHRGTAPMHAAGHAAGHGAGPVAGTGLGLNLVAAIAHLHGFALELDDARPGLVVRIVCYGAA